jgi:tRNA (guanine37-N1)-methyltransferase
MTWRATVLTIFPEMLPGPLAYSLAGKALRAGVWQLETVDIRDFARDKHRSVDDAPFGGGPGMVMRADVLDAAVAGAGRDRAVAPAVAAGTAARPGAGAQAFSDAGVTLICSRFRGRERAGGAPSKVSLGDFVLSGARPAAIALIDACVRILRVPDAPERSRRKLCRGLLEYPHYR